MIWQVNNFVEDTTNGKTLPGIDPTLLFAVTWGKIGGSSMSPLKKLEFTTEALRAQRKKKDEGVIIVWLLLFITHPTFPRLKRRN
jgi:hypothetical protein